MTVFGTAGRLAVLAGEAGQVRGGLVEFAARPVRVGDEMRKLCRSARLCRAANPQNARNVRTAGRFRAARKQQNARKVRSTVRGSPGEGGADVSPVPLHAVRMAAGAVPGRDDGRMDAWARMTPDMGCSAQVCTPTV